MSGISPLPMKMSNRCTLVRKSTASVRVVIFAGVILLGSVSACCSAETSEPSGPHPRLYSDSATTSGLKDRARVRNSFVARTVERCQQISDSPSEFLRDGYMGLDWAQHLQSCLVAWRATDREAYARTAVRYFKALIDDLTVVGDGKGGDNAARRDSGYAIRAHGPYTALAYDWLYSRPEIDAEFRARARQRFKAWTTWYLANGYRARSPGTNYNAGYVFAATLIAIAQGGDAGQDGGRLWQHVVADIFGKDLLPSAASGVLRGGDWGEGWQYAPLSVASYALAARAVEPYGVDVAPMRAWLSDVARRHVYALTPGADATYVGGDTQAETANLPVRRETLAAVVVGPAPMAAKQWAQAELERLQDWLEGPTFSLFGALADAGKVSALAFPRATSSRGFLAAGTSTLYWRTSWRPTAVWFVSPCSRQIDVDHVHPNAGNFVLSRGDDDLIVDPSPYGTLSSLTSNAPTMESAVLPDNYRPSQAFWGERTGFRWAKEADSGELLLRCDYTDQYKIQETPTDMAYAVRDFLVLPFAEDVKHESAAIVIIDRARRRDSGGALHLRFRAIAGLQAVVGKTAVRGETGGSSVTITSLWASGLAAETRQIRTSNCFTDNFTRGNCDAARFEISERKLTIAAPAPAAVHLVDAAAKRNDPTMETTSIDAQGGMVWQLRRATKLWTVGMMASQAPMTFSARPGSVLVVPSEAGATKDMRVQSTLAGGNCRVMLGGGAGVVVDAQPIAFRLADNCTVSAMTTSGYLPDNGSVNR